MDWPTYKRLCDSPHCWSRWMLERSAALLEAHAEPGLAASVRAALDAAPLPKPADHRGPAATDMFVLRLDTAAAQRIRAIVAGAAAAGERTAEGRGLGGFVEAWDEYLRAGATAPPW